MYESEETDTGSEVEVLEEISTPSKSSAVAAAEALVALSANKPSPVKVSKISLRIG